MFVRGARGWAPPTGATPPDGLCADSPPGLHWTTSNFGEAMPGVQTPLSQSVWGTAMEWASRRLLYEMGVLTRREHRGRLPAPLESPMLRSFYGRMAYPVEFFTLIGDRVPGISGEEIVLGMLGIHLDDVTYRATRSRYPMIALRMPYVFATSPRRLARAGRRSESWYHVAMLRIPDLELPAAVGLLRTAVDRFRQAVMLQGLTRMAVIQPLYQALTDIVTRTGTGDIGILSGAGGPEVTGLMGDIWKASQGQLDLDLVRRRHGFHGPMEGELSSRVWREDSSPLRDLVARYALQPNPVLLALERETRRIDLVGDVLAATPRARRPDTRLVLELAARRIPLLGVAKRTFLQCFDVARASARRVGECHTASGALEDASDAFFMTLDELISPPAGCRDRVEVRRVQRERCFDYDVPNHWKGTLDLVPETTVSVRRSDARVRLTGVGVGHGVVVARARVVLNSNFAEVAQGEILVAPFTDPGWAPIMLMSSGLVVDIGGALSHAAVVARELGIPCVVNTRTGTRQIRTGDLIRVDGASGFIDIVERAGGVSQCEQESR